MSRPNSGRDRARTTMDNQQPQIPAWQVGQVPAWSPGAPTNTQHPAPPSGWPSSQQTAWPAAPPTAPSYPPAPPSGPLAPPPLAGVAPRPAGGSRPGSLSGLGTAVQVLSWIAAGVVAVNALVHVLIVPALTAYIDAPTGSDLDELGAVVRAGDTASTWAGLSTLAIIAVLVLFMIWMWRAHSATSYIQPGPRSWARGWTIGGWFVPVANFVIPRLVLADIEKTGAHLDDPGLVGRSGALRALGHAWCACLGVGLIITAIGDGMATDGTTLSDARGGFVIEALGLAAAAAAWCFLAVMIKRLSAVIDARVARATGPVAAGAPGPAFAPPTFA